MTKARMIRVLLITTLLAALLASPLAAVAQEEVDGITHEVKWGETLSWIAWRYGVSVQDIVEANDLANRNSIFAGQELTIPVSTEGYTTHVVQPGESLLSIAADYGVPVWDIARLNGIWNINLIFEEQELLVPAAEDGEEADETPEPAETPEETAEPAETCIPEQIVISSPAMGEEVSSPVTITGFGSGFENNLAVDILDQTGNVIGQGFVTIDAEIGERGPFTGTVEFDPPESAQTGRIAVYEVSARDGGIEHLSSMTVTLQP